ncbi:zf-HC2 domain-containing protein [Streptomyces sp. NPDC048606]|uniref:zf-HC2 domain-containing protein n=1 Tax=Streptomyces sp. NPDC048606 TaxID=3154726 RepID=UPI00341C8FA9
MTPTTGKTGTIRHPEVSEISDLTEGVLSPSRTAEVRRHLGGCALCADVRDSLEEIRSLLGTLPGPPRMPSSVAGRIDAALAAEALLESNSSRATAEAEAEAAALAGAGSGGGGDGSDVSRETSTGPVHRATPGRPSGHPSGPNGPGRRRARRRIAVIAGLAGAGVCAFAVFLFNASGGPAPSDTSARATASQAPTEGSDRSSEAGGYTAQGLGGQVRQLLAAGSGTNKTMGLDSAPPGVAPSDRQASPETAGAPSCVRAATGRTETPLATELGSYRGTAAYLLVLPHAGDAALVDAYLVDASCADDPAKTPGGPLLTGTYPRT